MPVAGADLCDLAAAAAAAAAAAVMLISVGRVDISLEISAACAGDLRSSAVHDAGRLASRSSCQLHDHILSASYDLEPVSGPTLQYKQVASQLKCAFPTFSLPRRCRQRRLGRMRPLPLPQGLLSLSPEAAQAA